MLYYGTMHLGTPGQELTVCPDTGSAAIWTSADNTPPAASGNSKIAQSYNGFVSNASSSFQVDSHHAPLSCQHTAFASVRLHDGMLASLNLTRFPSLFQKSWRLRRYQNA